ncbi:hypothetical protein EW146_g4642 [Bondarzewia mesenterica]|uniref:Structural maintenance of chromosomes protein n=1 Tax=Bondarzewia mesenterica TaxID=1095465 RepID=A0A4V3XF29_9AGAM|nr:hypothetical protein EW146_g4642 [Bondarzewia mesenterica]
MRIEELVLEGFKSYPVRTQITGWDASFNAITGLNGSGKSNILDAICFVLGITNMSSMRAQNQQDLIYKRGQAGITKASVTIVFDNSDRAMSPVGLENSAHNSDPFPKRAAKYQQPEFSDHAGSDYEGLAKEREILGMVEEAAGTRMFEERKDKAKKTMGKKEKRVEEITSLLAEEITPKLDTLRAEKRSFLKWQKACSELERIGRMLRAWEWTEYNKRVEQKQEEIERKEEETSKTKKLMNRLEKECSAAERDAERVKALRDKELKKGGKFKKLEEEVAELEKVLVKVRTQVEIKNATITDEEGKVTALEAERKELEELRTAKKAQVEELETSYAKVKEKHTATQTALSNSEDLLQTLLTGLTTGKSSNTGGGYMGQLADAKARLAHATAEEEQSRVKLEMSKKELNALEARWREVEKEAGDGARRVEVMKVEVEKYRRKVTECGWSAEKEHAHETALKTAKAELRQAGEERDAAKQRLSQLDFNYTIPSPNFDSSKVKGLVASLISLNPPEYNKSTALEITAGGKLYNVVVEDERVGKELLQNGRLKKRVTIIPLNKISSSKMPAQKLDVATRLAPGKVRLALSLIGYPDEVSNAMVFVFGDTLICDDAESAKLVTFSKEVGGVRSVTLDGDIYDPSGTLSGGSAPSGSGLLVKVQEVQSFERKLRHAKENYDALESEEQRGRQARETWRRLARDLEIKEHELRLLEEQIEGSNANRIGSQIEELKLTISQLEGAVQSAKDKQKAAKEECKKLEKDMDEFKNNKEGKTEELKADILKQKTALQKQAVGVKTQQKELQTATLEYEQMEKDIDAAGEAVKEAKRAVEKLHKELGKLNDEVTAREAEHAKAERRLQDERATLTRFDTELRELEGVIKEKKQAVSDADLELKKLEHEIQTMGKEKAAAMTNVTNLEKQFEWIAEENHLFGKEGSQYDFESVDIGAQRKQATELEEQQRGMKKKVNPKVINMIDSVEKREAALKKMLTTVLKDKEKIEQTIEELDRYKRDALQKTWEKVNGDFGGIFAELLPGNFAKLQPPEGQDLMDGLEIKIRLGSVWKQSLTELSGGQRSLIALSLILALLQFKPAPVYILDEIDAALDLSHTQHIGTLFRTRFRGAQFIVVSLKEGLFTNANVLFRTRFRDGTSVVEQTAQRSASALYAAERVEGNEEQPRRSRRAA